MYKIKHQPALILLLAALFALSACGMQEEDPEDRFVSLISSRAAEGDASRADPGYMQYLEKQSLQGGAVKLAQIVSGSNHLWRHAYAEPRPEELSSRGSVWLHLNPQTLRTPSRASVLAHLTSPALWVSLNQSGITGLYLAPTGGNGSLWAQDQKRGLGTGEDVIQYSFGRNVGTEQEYSRIIERSKTHHVLLGGDLIPVAGGIGPDFMLATRNLRDYPGLFCMIEVPRPMWSNLPPMRQQGGDLQLTPLTLEQQRKLSAGGLFPEALRQDSMPQFIKTGWAATGEIRGTDGNLRRWVYRYAYNSKRPLLNFSDPSNLANKVMSGSVIFQSGVLGNTLAAHAVSPLLGLEPESEPPKNITDASSHSLALEVSTSLSRQTRAYGSYSLLKDELPLPLLYEAMQDGPDLVLDSALSPAAEHALLSGDASLLNFMADEALNFRIDWSRLVHASTGHAGISYQLPHLEYLAALPDSAQIQRARLRRAEELRQATLRQAERLASPRQGDGNLFEELRLHTTPAGLAALAVGVYRPSELTPDKAEMIRRGHMSLQFFKAMQPGVFMVSGQDLTGTMPIELSAGADGREPDKKLALIGSYPLLASAETGIVSSLGLPRAKTLYGTIDAQLYNPNSFFSELGRLLRLREKLGIAQGKVVWRFQPENSGMIALLIRLPQNDQGGSGKAAAYALAISNFSQSESSEKFDLARVPELKEMLGWAELRALEGNISSVGRSGNSLYFTAPGWSWGLVLLKHGDGQALRDLGHMVPNDQADGVSAADLNFEGDEQLGELPDLDEMGIYPAAGPEEAVTAPAIPPQLPDKTVNGEPESGRPATDEPVTHEPATSFESDGLTPSNAKDTPEGEQTE